MSGDSRYDVAGTGSMVVDVISRVPALGRGDDKVLLSAERGAPPLARHVGGVTLNHLGWAAALGLRTAIFGKIGDDADGRLLRSGMRTVGIADHLDASGSHSSFAHVYVDPTGERAIYMARGATGELTPDEIDRLHGEVIARGDFVSTEVSQVPLPTVRRVLERAREAGARTVLDLDVPPSAALVGLGSEAELHAVLALADVLKCSRASAAELVAGSSPAAFASGLAKRFGCGLVVVTAGADGATLFASGKARDVPALRVGTVDATGAGDAFLGGLLAGLVRGLGPEDLGRLASAAGAACCEQLGAFPTEPERVRARVLGHYAELGGTPLAPAASGPAVSSAVGSEGGPEAPVDAATERYLASAPAELERAARALDRAALAAAADRIGASEAAGGRLHVTGIGKPGHVARYAAALLASTGTPAVFLDASEATHGSVGQLRTGDVVIAISNSGTTAELLAAVDAARGLGAEIIAVTGRAGSPLAERAAVVIRAGVDQEGGPLGLAPRNSVLVETLAVCALSVELQARRPFDRAAYQARHPGGALGRRTRPD